MSRISSRGTGTLSRGQDVYAIAREPTRRHLGYILVLLDSRDLAQELQALGEKLRGVLEYGASTNARPETLMHEVRTHPLLPSYVSVSIALLDTDKLWVMARGDVQLYRWTVSDALARLTPAETSSDRWFCPKRPIPLVAGDRVISISDRPAARLHARSSMYLHKAELQQIISESGERGNTAAWTSAQVDRSEAGNQTKPHEFPPSQKDQFWKKLSLALVVLIAAGVLGLGLLSSNHPENHATPINTANRTLVAPALNPPSAPIPTPPPTNAANARPDENQGNAIEDDPSTELTIRSVIRENTARSRFFRTVFNGELRVSMLKVRTGELPPISSLPVAYRSLFEPPPEGQSPIHYATVQARRAQTLLTRWTLLGESLNLQDFEAQVTSREDDATVRAWLKTLHQTSNNPEIRGWANEHLGERTRH